MDTTDRKRGFALAMVVFMLFAATVAGITGYQIVSAEALLADGNESQSEALFAANAGIERYLGEHLGVPGVVTYAVGNGSATIRPRKLARLNDSTDLYLLTSVGTVTDPRFPTSPATRTTYQHATLNRRPLWVAAAFMTTQATVNLDPPNTLIDGSVYLAGSASTDCPANDANALDNIESLGSSGTTTGGSTDPVEPSGTAGRFRQLGTSPASVISAAALRWSVLTDPTFPIPYDGTWPNFATIPSDSFPVIRVSGDYTLDRNGRGALIVPGTFTDAGSYTWQGIILAGQAAAGSWDNGNGAGVVIRGAVITGLNGSVIVGAQHLRHLAVVYYPCWVRRANLSLAYLTPVSRSSWTF